MPEVKRRVKTSTRTQQYHVRSLRQRTKALPVRSCILELMTINIKVFEHFLRYVFVNVVCNETTFVNVALFRSL